MTDNTDDIDEVRADIRRRAALHADAAVYSLNNNYLSPFQKVMLEAVYQFPLGVMHYAMAFFALWLDYSLWHAYLAGTAVGIVAFLAARFLPGRLFWPMGRAFGFNGGTIVTLILAGIAAWLTRYGTSAYLALAAFGLTSFVELPLWLWSLFERRRYNPKYGIAKRMFDVRFPFEDEVD